MRDATLNRLRARIARSVLAEVRPRVLRAPQRSVQANSGITVSPHHRITASPSHYRSPCSAMMLCDTTHSTLKNSGQSRQIVVLPNSRCREPHAQHRRDNSLSRSRPRGAAHAATPAANQALERTYRTVRVLPSVRRTPCTSPCAHASRRCAVNSCFPACDLP